MRIQASTPTVALLVFLLHTLQVGAQNLDAKKTEELLHFAEKFLVACSTEDPSLKEMMGLPFMVYAPCKGGPHDSVEEFRDNILRRGNGIQPPKDLLLRKVITVERFLRSFPAELFVSEKDREEQIKRYGADVHVICLIYSKNCENFALAVLVRTNGKGLRAVGLGFVSQKAIH